jgi:hypothetical protein
MLLLLHQLAYLVQAITTTSNFFGFLAIKKLPLDHFTNQTMMNSFHLKKNTFFVVFVIQLLWVLMCWDQRFKVGRDWFYIKLKMGLQLWKIIVKVIILTFEKCMLMRLH